MFGTELKICGLSRLEDIIAVNRHGADYAGFVFFQKSKRYVDPYKANELISLLRTDIKPVGVFMDEPLDNVVFLQSEFTFTSGKQLEQGQISLIQSRVELSRSCS